MESDDCRRLKKDVRSLKDALPRLLQLRGVSYEYKDPAAIHERPGEQVGMIAQEVEEVFPDWVDESADGYKRLTFRGFEALAVEALRELHEDIIEKDSQIAVQATQIAELRTENEEMWKRLAALDTRGDAFAALSLPVGLMIPALGLFGLFGLISLGRRNGGVR